MTRATRAAIILVAGLAITGRALAWISRLQFRSYYDTRRLVILAHARQTPDPVVILGDSIVDMADLPQMCGKSVLNAGIIGRPNGGCRTIVARLNSVKPASMLPAAS